jgi:macrolide transport system ATP-binding/permease protein
MRESLTRRALSVVRSCAWLVPSARRAEWRRQWDADLQAQAAFLLSDGHTPAAIRRDLTTRSLGAARHALWLRTHHWRTLMTAQDFRHAFRGFAQRPGFTAAIVLTLGLSIGATTTIFSWVDALVLNPLPGVPRASELVLVRFATPTRTDLSFSYPNYRDVRDAAPAGIQGIAVKNMMAATIRIDDGAPERMWTEVASGNLFEVLNVRAVHGRVLQPDDEREVRPVAVISHALWRTRFLSDTGIIGRGVSVNGVPLTIVGVAPEGFRGAMGGLAMDLWLPITLHTQLTGQNVIESRGNGFLSAIARLAPGATARQAEASLRAVSDRMVEDGVIGETWRLRVAPLSEDGVAMVLLPVVSVLMGLVVLVLLIACANVSGLLLARAVARQHELAVRTALGAGRWRLVRQLLLESALLAAAGGLAGVLLAQWTSRGLEALLPPLPYPILIEASVNIRVLAFSLMVVAAATMVFGLIPALQGSRTRLMQAVRASRASSSTPGRARLRSALVVAQVALALVLLVCAGLFLRTLSNAYDVDPGFTRRNAVLATFDLSALRLDATKGRALLDEILARVATVPGVERVSASTLVPLSVGGGSDTSPAIDGYTPDENEEVVVYYGMVTEGYFDTLGIPLVAGRAIDERDRASSEPAVVINETMARRYWAGREAVGGRLRIGPDWITVVGVARDGKYGQLTETPRSVMYFPIQQIYRSAPVLQVATTGPAGPAMERVRRAVAEVAPELALYDVRTLEEHLRMSVAVPRMAALLLGIFGGLALVLSAVGLSGVIAFSVSQRTQEIGVRMALGADRGRVLRSVLGQGARLGVLGVALGIGGAILATPFLDSLLVNVSATDPLTFAITAGVLLLVAVAAAWIPARRAAGLNPVDALRAE